MKRVLFLTLMSCGAAFGLTVSTNGVAVANMPAGAIAAEAITVEVGAGESETLGNLLEVLPVFTVVETYSAPGNGFERGLSPWTTASIATNGDNEASSVKANGAAFDTSGGYEWTTPSGSQYLMLRRDSRASVTVDIPTGGSWRVRYLCGCRPNSTLSLNIPVKMKVDGETIHEVAPVTRSADLFPFTEFVTSPFALEAGEHVFAIENYGSTHNGSLNYDDIRFERVTGEYGTFTKTGTGTLVPADQQAFTNARVSVSAGELVLTGTTFANTTINVAGDGTASLAQPGMSGPVVIDVAAGGTLALSDMDTNLVSNGSFEAQTTEGTVPGNPRGWTCSNVKATTNSSSGYGYQRNGSSMSNSGSLTSYGNQTLYLREFNHAEQEINVPESGSYRISHVQADRNGYAGYTMPVYVKVDGETIFTVPPESANYDFKRISVDVALSAGTHTIAYETGDDADGSVRGTMVFIDDVSVRHIAPLDLSNAEVRLAAGSTLALDLALPTFIQKFRVDGTQVKGRSSAIMAAGVTVSGTTANIRAGNPPGTRLIMR